MIRLARWLALGAVLISILCGCGSTTLNPTPILSTMTPEHTTAGGPTFTLNVVALDIVTTSTVDWNGSPRMTTTDANTGQLAVQILASDIATPGQAEVTVVSPTPGGGISNDLTFFIDPPANPAPGITSLTPSSAAPGGPAFSLVVSGTGFVSNSSVNWNGSPRATTFNSSTQLTAGILATDIANAGSANVTVTNPSPGGGTSAVAVFTIAAGAASSAETPAMKFRLVSVTASGLAANGPSGEPRMDQSGRFIAFESMASNLLSTELNARVFLRDTCWGSSNCTPETIAVDVAQSGDAPNAGVGRGLGISPDGRYVAFSSQATNLVSGEFRAGPQIYLRDTCRGSATPAKCSPSTILISVAFNGTPGDAASEFPSVTENGRYVVFASAASNLVAGVSGGVPQIYIRDTCLGAALDDCVPRTTLISADGSGEPGKGASLQSSVSRDGRYVAFDSQASNLGSGTFTGLSNVFLRDTCLGESAPVGCRPFTALVSTSADGLTADGPSFAPAISDSGTYVAFATRASNLVNDDASRRQKIVVRNTCLNVEASDSCAPLTSLVSASGPGDAHAPFISADGRYISYVTEEPVSSGATVHAYLRDTCAGVVAAPCTARTSSLLSSTAGKASQLGGGRSPFGAPVNLDGNVIVLFSAGPVPGLKGNLNGSGDVIVGDFPTAQ